MYIPRIHMGVSKNSGIPKWMVYNGNPWALQVVAFLRRQVSLLPSDHSHPGFSCTRIKKCSLGQLQRFGLHSDYEILEGGNSARLGVNFSTEEDYITGPQGEGLICCYQIWGRSLVHAVPNREFSCQKPKVEHVDSKTKWVQITEIWKLDLMCGHFRNLVLHTRISTSCWNSNTSLAESLGDLRSKDCICPAVLHYSCLFHNKSIPFQSALRSFR